MREFRNEKTNGKESIEASVTNGISHNSCDGELQNGEYSADEEIPDQVQQKEHSEDEQPSLETRPSVTPTSDKDGKRISTRSASKTSSISKAKAALSEVRQRFSGIQVVRYK